MRKNEIGTNLNEVINGTLDKNIFLIEIEPIVKEFTKKFSKIFIELEQDDIYQKIYLYFLEKIEKKVLLLRFGFYGEIFTLAEVGTQYHITSNRVRQIEQNALKKIRENAYDLKDYLEIYN